MSENICPLCGKEAQNEEVFCRDCQEIAENSYPSELLHNNEHSDVSAFEGEPSGEEQNTAPESNAEIEQPLSDNEEAIGSKAEGHPQQDAPSDKPKKPRSSRKLLIFYGIGLVIFTVIGVASTYQMVKSRQSEETERAYWNQCIEENTPLAYSKYLFRYPEGQFNEMAQEKIMELREKERQEWETLKKSNDVNAFFSFLTDHPETPYAREIKVLMDSLSWITTTKDNTADAYLAYIENVKLGHLQGEYQQEAQEKYDYLSQLKTVEGEDLTAIKKTLKDFFTFLGQKKYKSLEELMAPALIRYYALENKSKGDVVKWIESDMKERKIKNASYLAETDSLDVIQDNKGIYFLTLPVKFQMKKEKSESALNIELNDKKQIQALYEKDK